MRSAYIHIIRMLYCNTEYYVISSTIMGKCHILHSLLLYTAPDNEWHDQYSLKPLGLRHVVYMSY